jgi:hypothetical protein
MPRNRIPYLFALLALAFAALGLAAQAHAQLWSGETALGIRVEDKKGDPVVGAEVVLSFVEHEPFEGPPPLITDASGSAELIRLAAGRWRIDIRSDDRSAYTAVLRIEPGKKPTITAGPIRDAVAPPLKVTFLKSPEAARQPAVEKDRRRGRDRSDTSKRDDRKKDDRSRAERRRAEREAASRTPPPSPTPAPPLSPAPPIQTIPPAAPAQTPAPAPVTPKAPSPTPQATPAPAEAPAPPKATAPPVVSPPVAPPADTPTTKPKAEAGPAVPALPTAPEQEELPKPPVVSPPAPVPTQAPAQVPAPAPTPAPTQVPPAAPALVTPPVSEPPAAEAPPAAPAAQTPPQPPQAEQVLPPTPEPEPAVPSPGEPQPWANQRREIRAFTDSACPGCKTGEWAVIVEQTVDGDRKDCPSKTDRLDLALTTLLRERGADGLAEYEGSPLELLPAADQQALAPFLNQGTGCQAVVTVLPAGARFAGYGYEVRDAQGGGACQAGADCSLGQCRWPAHPVVKKSENGTLIYSLFQNQAVGRERIARLIVYFAPPRAGGVRP